MSRLEALMAESLRCGEIHLFDVRTVARVLIAALITRGGLTDPNRIRDEEAIVELFIGALRGAAA